MVWVSSSPSPPFKNLHLALSPPKFIFFLPQAGTVGSGIFGTSPPLALLVGDSPTAPAGSQDGFGRDWEGGRQGCGAQPCPVPAGAFPQPWERGQLGAGGGWPPMGFKRSRCAVGTWNGHFRLTMRALVLLAALVAAAAGIETFVG